MDKYITRNLINVDGRLVELESFNIDPSWRGEWFVLGVAIGFLAGMLVVMWFNWPCFDSVSRPFAAISEFLECML